MGNIYLFLVTGLDPEGSPASREGGAGRHFWENVNNLNNHTNLKHSLLKVMQNQQNHNVFKHFLIASYEQLKNHNVYKHFLVHTN